MLRFLIIFIHCTIILQPDRNKTECHIHRKTLINSGQYGATLERTKIAKDFLKIMCCGVVPVVAFILAFGLNKLFNTNLPPGTSLNK